MFGTISRLQKQLLNTCHELSAEVNTLCSAEGTVYVAYCGT